MGSKKRYAKYTKFLVYLLVVVLLNIAGLTLFFRLDLTRNQIYSISKASKEVVSTLTEPLTINVFFTKNLPAPYNNIERYLRDLLEEYAVSANRNFNYKFFNVSPDTEGVATSAPENQRLAENYGIRPVQVQAIESDEVKFKRAYMGLVMIHGDMVERIPTITTVDGLEYKLTTAIQKLNNKISAMLGLSDKIQVQFIMSPTLKNVAPYMGLNELADYPDKVKEIVDKVNGRMYGKLEYTFMNPANDTEQEALLKAYDIMHLKWPAIPDSGIEAGSGVIGLIMSHDEKVREIPVLSVMRIPIIGTQYNLMPIEEMEEVINENVETLVDINENIGYLAGNGTLDVSGFSPFGRQMPDSLNNFSSLVSQNYSIKPVNLEEGRIPASLNSMIIARPTEKISDYDLFQIDQALMRGTNLILFLDAFKESQNPQQNMGFNQGPMFEPFDSGLEKLLDAYGISIKRSMVLDENCHRQRVPQHMGGGEQAIYFAPIIKNENINHDLSFMKDIKGLIAVQASPLELDDKKLSENGITARKVFSSSKDSWEMRDRIMLNPMFMKPPQSDDEKESKTLACILEGEFKSYFDGKPIPEKVIKSENPTPETPDAKTETGETPAEKTGEPAKPDLDKFEESGAFLAKGKPAKIFLMASSHMLKDNIISQEGTSPNDMFVMNLVDAMNDKGDIAAMRSKAQRFNPLSDTRSSTKAFLKIFNVVGLPVLVVIFGLIVMFRRHTRKKQIQMLFQQ